MHMEAVVGAIVRTQEAIVVGGVEKGQSGVESRNLGVDIL
jgi:hypothetical protein